MKGENNSEKTNNQPDINTQANCKTSAHNYEKHSEFFLQFQVLYFYSKIICFSQNRKKQNQLQCCKYIFILTTLVDTVFHSNNIVAFCDDINNHTADISYIVYLALQECTACEVGYTCKVPIQIFILWNSMKNMNSVDFRTFLLTLHDKHQSPEAKLVKKRWFIIARMFNKISRSFKPTGKQPTNQP